MNDKSTGVHWSFWLVGAIALLWNIMGVLNYFMQMSPTAVAAMPETHRTIIEGRPAWATGGFAIAVFGGSIGGLLLLLRKSLATYVFIASSLGVVVTMVHTIRVALSVGHFGTFEWLMMILMPLLVAALLIWYSKQAEVKGWLN